MNISEMLYPDKIPALNGYDGDIITGGIMWGVSPNNYRYVYKEVRDIIFDFGITAGSHGTYDVFKFPNGYSIKIYAELVFQSGRSIINCAVNWYDEYNNIVTNVSNFTVTLTELPSALSEGYCLKIFFLTRYGFDPVENVSEPIEFGFYAGVFNYLIHTYDSPLIISGNDTTQTDIVNDVRGVTGQSNITYYNTALYTFTDTDTLDDWLHERGLPFSGSVVGEEPPAGGDDTSETGGGKGNYDKTSDPVDFPNLPTGGALTSGMIRGYLVSRAILETMQNTLWNMSAFDIDVQFQKLVSQPMDCIISLHCVPVIPPNNNQQRRIKLGSFDTGADGIVINGQFMEVDGGELDVKEFWGSALDYSPYTRAEIFIPFCGIKQLQIDDIQNVKLVLKYHIDVLTGDVVAFLKCGNSVMYTWHGSCISHVPCTSYSNDRLVIGAANAVSSLGMGLAKGSAASAVGGVISAAANTVVAKDSIRRSGDITGSAGLMSYFNAFLIIHRPIQSLAKGYNKFKGYPTNVTYTLGSLSGYTEVEHINLQGISNATESEMQEIKNLLQAGVIL